jgi:magnesium-protoporphyrin O-methyltransferase
VDREPEPRCCWDDYTATFAQRARKKGTAAAVTRSLLVELERADIRGSTVLDVGCGVGDLALATLERGAASVDGIDLGSASIEEARRMAVERDLAARATFVVGDGARADLSPHDVVVVNRVFCCYRDVDALLERSLAAAGRLYAYTVPISRGLTGAFNRVALLLANAWYALRPKRFGDFRTFVHDVAAIDRRVRDAGFSPIATGRRRVIWQLAVYERAA